MGDSLDNLLSGFNATGVDVGEVEWSEPVDLFGEFNPPEFPAQILTPLLREWAEFQHAATGADKAGYIMAALTVCSVAIPDHVKLNLNANTDWEESTRMWTILEGRPSTKKTPIFKTSMKPLVKIDAQKRQRTHKALKVYEQLEADERRMTTPPSIELMILEDTTIEASQQLFADNPGGLMLHQDEMTGFFGAMDKYSSGKGSDADRAYWLKAFNGGSHTVNRISRGGKTGMFIQNLSVCILGGIQPDPMQQIANGLSDNGLIQRLFVIVLRQPARRQVTTGMPHRREEYDSLVERLHYTSAPIEHTFSQEAQKLFHSAEEQYEAMGWSLETTNLKLATHIGKFAGMLARLCLTLHYIENPEPPVVVSKETLLRAKHIMDTFLLPQSYAFYSRLLEEIDPVLNKVAGYILAHPEKTVLCERDVVRGRQGITADEGQKVFQRLASVGWVREIEPEARQRVPKWEPNPKVHQYFAEIAEKEAERRKQAHTILTGFSSRERNHG